MANMIILQEVKMTEQVFLRVDSYIWLGSSYTYCEANGASVGISTMLNLDKVLGEDISTSFLFVVTIFTNHSGSSSGFTFYAPNTRNSRLVVWN